MKKYFIIVLFIAIIFGVWYFNSRPKNENNYTDIQNITPETIVQNDKKDEVVKTVNDKPLPPEPSRIVKTEDANFSRYDQIEKAWLSQAQNILGNNDFQFYQDLRNQNDEEKMQAYKEFHDYLRKKHGDNFSYHISEDQSVREKAINTKYTQVLIKRIGEERFKQYLKARDQFNEDLQRKAKDGHAIIIEF